MLHIVLFRPEIPQNTGNVGRLCAVTRSQLHLIHPLGFRITDRHLRRSGMDYWRTLNVIEHRDWNGFLASPQRPQRILLFSTQATRSFWDVRFSPGDGLLFGQESAGCPDWLHDWAGPARITIPQPNQEMRSLNLSTAVGIATYEALRQISLGEQQK